MVKHVTFSYVYNLFRCGEVVKPGMVEIEMETKIEMEIEMEGNANSLVTLTRSAVVLEVAIPFEFCYRNNPTEQL